MAPQTKIDRSFSALTPALSEWIIEAVDFMGFVKTTPGETPKYELRVRHTLTSYTNI
jgi:hypothetical protein